MPTWGPTEYAPCVVASSTPEPTDALVHDDHDYGSEPNEPEPTEYLHDDHDHESEPNEPEPVNPAPIPSSSILPTTSTRQPLPPSHPMITWDKAGIFKPRYQVDLASSSPHGLTAALHASTEPKGFKTASRYPH